MNEAWSRKQRHDNLSTDELLKLQEGPPLKKIRASTFVGPERLDDEASSTESSGDDQEDSEDNIDSFLSPVDDVYLGLRKSAQDGGRLGPSLTSPISTCSPLKKNSIRSFSDMGISPALEAALHRMSIQTPTEVQAACIPHILAGRDCIGHAKTGSGKTIAFAIPILQKLSDDPCGIFALVLSPTRELAFQISEQFAVLGAPLGIRTSVIVGGMDMMVQALELDSRPHVVVATPGRVVDHVKSSSGDWDLSRIKFLVLDEADRLLSPTFASELSHLFSILPTDRQTCLFTATVTPAVESVASMPPKRGKMMPFFHRTGSVVETVSNLNQRYILVPSHVRESYLFYLLCHPPEETLSLHRAPPAPAKNFASKKVGKSQLSRQSAQEDVITQPPPTIIFCTKPRTAAYLTSLLKTLSIRTTALHSRLTQRERLASLSLFRSAVVPVLVSTDVGARGLDIEYVAMVINWDLPNRPEEYTHRVGRTARAGKGGVAISFVTEKDEQRVLGIEDRIGTKLTSLTLPENAVLNKLNTVSTAKRVANMELHESTFGKREEIHKIKSQKRRDGGGQTFVEW